MTSNDSFRHFLTNSCPVLNETFWPTFWAFETRFQTAIRHYLQSNPIHNFERQLVPLPDGGLIAFDWLNPKGWLDKDEDAQANTPIVVICPGLTGDSAESYIGHLVNQVNALGFRAAVLIYRGNGNLPLLTPRVYSAASCDDLAWGLHEIVTNNPKSPIYGCGISLGAIIWYNYLASCQPPNKLLVRAVVTISMPWDCQKSAQSLERPVNLWAFNRHLAKGLQNRIRHHLHVFENHEDSERYDFELLFKGDRVRHIDENLICPMFGFSSASEYYDAISPCKHFKTLPCPVVSIQAADDVFALEETIPLAEIANLPKTAKSEAGPFQPGPLAVVMAARGGHIGFAEGLFPTEQTWADRLAGQLLMALHLYTLEKN